MVVRSGACIVSFSKLSNVPQEARVIPKLADANQIKQIQNSLFASFAASVEVGLQDFRGPEGPRQLFIALIRRYCDVEPINDRQASECKEARRQLCLLFALMEVNQPVEYLTRQLAAIDNGTIAEVVIESPGSGYAPGYGAPEVRFPPPAAGKGYESASGRAVLTPTGKILRIDVVNRGNSYTKAPDVTLAPPSTLSSNGTRIMPAQAKAKAFLFRSGPNKGRIERIQLVNPGEGYVEKEAIDIRISPPETSKKRGDTASAVAVLEYEVSAIKVIKHGSGYAVEKPVEVWVEPPPITARVNLNDPLVARIISPDGRLPQSAIPDAQTRRLMPPPSDPGSVTSQATNEARKASGCIGRECYDRPVIAKAYPTPASSQRSVFNTFRKSENKTARVLSASSAGDLPEPINFVTGELPELLSLLPAGIGLEFNAEAKRYELAVEKGNNAASLSRSRRRIDPDFGPRGRAPIEREVSLSLDSFLKFMLSGAICCSGVHLALTPIDVVKTKVQTDSNKYSGFSAFGTVFEEGGIDAFFNGWQPTFLGYFFWGGLSYALTEFLRRTLIDEFRPVEASLEILIILFAASMGAFVGSFVICPFESVRIRSVSQKDFAPTVWGVFLRMYKEEGLKSLFAAVPLFLGKEVPFAMAKFAVFDLSTIWLYQQFPAAREDLQLSLLVSLVGGTMGGIAAAIVSNPADVTISVLKKAKNDIGVGGAAAMIIDDGGLPALFTGLPLRMVFYSLVVSLQFLVYDSVRFALGIGADDLKQYLNVLGGALSETGGPI